ASLDVVDESHQHAGHAGHREGGETHFRVYIVAEAFRGKSRLERHRMINETLVGELAGGVHALAIPASAPGESHAGHLPASRRSRATTRRVRSQSAAMEVRSGRPGRGRSTADGRDLAFQHIALAPVGLAAGRPCGAQHACGIYQELKAVAS